MALATINQGSMVTDTKMVVDHTKHHRSLDGTGGSSMVRWVSTGSGRCRRRSLSAWALRRRSATTSSATFVDGGHPAAGGRVTLRSQASRGAPIGTLREGRGRLEAGYWATHPNLSRHRGMQVEVSRHCDENLERARRLLCLGLLVASPGPAWDLSERVQFVVGLGIRVLLRHLGPELDVVEDGVAKRLILWHASSVEGRHIQLYEPLPLLLGDTEPAVHVNQVSEPELAAEAVRPTERLGRERGQVIDVLGLSRSEQGLEHRISQDARIKGVLEPVETLLAASVFVQGGHGLRL